MSMKLSIKEVSCGLVLRERGFQARREGPFRSPAGLQSLCENSDSRSEWNRNRS